MPHQATIQTALPNDLNAVIERPLKSALFKGWRRKCPNCGAGPLIKGYLKVHDNCSSCDEDFSHHRSDDAPAYLTILIVCHLLAPALHIVFVNFRPEPLVMFSIFSIGCTVLTLYLLPRIKGAVIAFQWARYMHGFGSGT